jgi:hypothetical protein
MTSAATRAHVTSNREGKSSSSPYLGDHVAGVFLKWMRIAALFGSLLTNQIQLKLSATAFE